MTSCRNYILFVMLTTGLISFYSCQKEPELKDDHVTSTPSSRDPAALSAAIRVWHGIRTPGIMPAPKGGGLVLNNSGNEPIKAFAGRFAIIQPEVISGEPKGYYVSVNGSGQYFRVDYSRPRDISGRVRRAPAKGRTPFTGARPDSTGNGNVDSSIVLVLPADLKVPDTFCLSYCAYDSSGNVSQPVSVCIIVSSLGGDAGSGWINGSWKITSSWDSWGRDTVIYNKWISMGTDYYCESDSTGASYLDFKPNGTNPVVSDSMFFRKADLTFGPNGAQKYEEDFSGKWVDIYNSTCSQFSFETFGDDYTMTGGWSFNSATNKIIIIFEFDDSGIPVLEAWEYAVMKVNERNFIMIDDSDPSDPYFIRFEK